MDDVLQATTSKDTVITLCGVQEEQNVVIPVQGVIPNTNIPGVVNTCHVMIPTIANPVYYKVCFFVGMDMSESVTNIFELETSESVTNIFELETSESVTNIFEMDMSESVTNIFEMDMSESKPQNQFARV